MTFIQFETQDAAEDFAQNLQAELTIRAYMDQRCNFVDQIQIVADKARRKRFLDEVDCRFLALHCPENPGRES